MSTWRAGCGGSRTSGSEGGSEKPTSGNAGRALRPDPYTTKRIRQGSFGSVGELVTAIEDYIAHNNENPNPFVWTKTSGQIIAKVRRGRVALEQVRESRAI
jgi:hypothetical protein